MLFTREDLVGHRPNTDQVPFRGKELRLRGLTALEAVELYDGVELGDDGSPVRNADALNMMIDAIMCAAVDADGKALFEAEDRPLVAAFTGEELGSLWSKIEGLTAGKDAAPTLEAVGTSRTA